MQDVIKKIIKIEEKAQAIIEGANKEKDQIRRDFEEKVTSLENKIMGDARKKVKQLRERELSENKIASDKRASKCEKQIVAMEARVSEHKEQWVKELVENVLKR